MTKKQIAVEGIVEFIKVVRAERQRQIEKWGPQYHPDGTGSIVDVYLRDDAKHETDDALAHGEVTWKLILLEEIREALAEKDPERLVLELVQSAAVIQAWLADIAQRGTEGADGVSGT